MNRVQVMPSRPVNSLARKNNRPLPYLPRVGIIIKASAPLARMVDAERKHEPVKVCLNRHELGYRKGEVKRKLLRVELREGGIGEKLRPYMGRTVVRRIKSYAIYSSGVAVR